MARYYDVVLKLLFRSIREAGYYVEIYRAWSRHPRQALVYVGQSEAADETAISRALH